MKNWNAKIWLVALALPLPLGIVTADTPPPAPLPEATPTDEAPPAVGTLTVQWTISGRSDPVDCGGLGVARLLLSVRAAGAGEEQIDGPCDTFQLSLDLSPGDYSGDALLVDRWDRPVTLSVPIDQLNIVAGREVVESMDFPVEAFLASAP